MDVFGTQCNIALSYAAFFHLTCNPLVAFSSDLFSRYSWVALFLYGFAVSTAVLVDMCTWSHIYECVIYSAIFGSLSFVEQSTSCLRMAVISLVQSSRALRRSIDVVAGRVHCTTARQSDPLTSIYVTNDRITTSDIGFGVVSMCVCISWASSHRFRAGRARVPGGSRGRTEVTLACWAAPVDDWRTRYQLQRRGTAVRLDHCKCMRAPLLHHSRGQQSHSRSSSSSSSGRLYTTTTWTSPSSVRIFCHLAVNAPVGWVHLLHAYCENLVVADEAANSGRWKGELDVVITSRCPLITSSSAGVCD